MNCKELNEKLNILEKRVNKLSTKNEFMMGLVGKVGMKKADWENLADQLNDSDIGFNMKFEVEGNNIVGNGYIIKRPKNDNYVIVIRDTKTSNKLVVTLSCNNQELETVKGLRPKNILSTVSQLIRDYCEDCVPDAK